MLRKLPLDQGTFVRSFLDNMASTTTRLIDNDLADLAAPLVAAIDILRTTTDWLLARRDDTNDVLAGATPYCSMFGIVAGGWIMAESLLAASIDDVEKQTTVRFYLTQILPTAPGFAPSVMAGSADLFSLEADSF